MELHELSVREINKSLVAKKVSQDEVISHFQDRINRFDDKLQAFLKGDVYQPGVIDPASTEIAGVPFAVKDVLMVEGQECRGASKILSGYIAPYTATSVKKLVEADGVALGRTNCDEFAMGTSTENSAFGPTHNPWDLERVPGGSSGGSAAAVAAGLVPYALGSDTGGSIRQPASLTGIVGLKPTYGRVSRYGLMALASSFDTVGCFTRRVEDAAVIMKYLAGYDPLDSTTINAPVADYDSFLDKGVAGLRVGVPKEYFIPGTSAGTAQAVKEAISKLEGLGAQIVDVSLPSSQYGLAAYYIILPVEVSANLSRYDGVKYGLRGKAGNLAEQYSATRGQGFGSEAKRRIMLGAYASSSGYYEAYYKQALGAQAAIRRDFAKVFNEVDILVSPTSPVPAFKLGEKAEDPLQLYLADIFTVGVNISGIPAISVPCGFDNNLPVGLQIMAPWFREDLLFQAAGAYEASTEWHKAKPPVW